MTEKHERTLKIKKEDRDGGRFMSGVAVLTVSTVIVKLIGVLYKIPMIKYLGEDGMGYFNSAYEIYTFFYIIATAGLPVAISIMVARNAEEGNTENVKRIFGVSLGVLLALGALGTFALLFGAEFFGNLIGNKGAVLSIVAIAPMALLICVSSAVRGYFQGHQNMVPTAVSQVIEALGKLGLGLGLAIWSIRAGYSVIESAAFATLGITVGVALSMLYLLISKTFSKERNSVCKIGIPTLERKRDIIKELSRIAIPITLSSAVISLTRIIDLVMILRRLQNIGYTEEAANSIYGSYSTLAVSMFNLPASLVTPLALSLVPVLTAAIGSRNAVKERETLNASLKLCGLIIIPAAFGLSAFSKPILELVFAGETGAINVAAPLLSILAISTFFSCLMTVTNAILQAYGKERKPIVSMLAGSTVKIVLSYILIGIPGVNIYGAPISTLVCDITVSFINIAYIKRSTIHMETPMSLFGRTLVSAAISIGTVAVTYYSLLRHGTIAPSGGVTLFAVIVAVIFYAMCSLKTKAIGENEILILPKGQKIYAMLKKIKLMK